MYEPRVEATGQQIPMRTIRQIDLSIFSRATQLSIGRRRCAPVSNQETAIYASSEDFCRLFEKEMESLYLLSLLLTGQHSLAERCFVDSLEDSRNGNLVFKEWALAWARRSIIQRAIQMIRPQTIQNRRSNLAPDGGVSRAITQPTEIANIVCLPQFERFVFVISVLEHYSPQECSLLLDCTRSDVIATRTSALQQITLAAEILCKVVSSDSDEEGHTALDPLP